MYVCFVIALEVRHRATQAFRFRLNIVIYAEDSPKPITLPEQTVAARMNVRYEQGDTYFQDFFLFRCAVSVLILSTFLCVYA